MRPTALPRGLVHVRVVLPRCTGPVARRSLALLVKHELALGGLGRGPGARALVLTLGRVCGELRWRREVQAGGSSRPVCVEAERDVWSRG